MNYFKSRLEACKDRISTWNAREYVRTRKWQLVRHSFQFRVVGVPLYILHFRLDPSFVPLYVAKVTRGLKYLKGHDPRRYARLVQDVDRILVTHQEGPQYDPRFRAVVLREKTLVREPIPEVALTLVHEATHARIHAAGIEYVPELRGRIEHACVNQEIAFTRRIPEGEKLAEECREKLQDPWWTEEKLYDRQIAEMVDSYIPRWLARALLRVRSLGN